MYKKGITTAINSDDAEMGRRLNQEAAKTMKYGGVPELEALKMVTINPARLLHIDHRTGSLRKGKDADLVLWTDHPLSVNAKVMQTYVDGICFYDRRQDERLRIKVLAEKNRIVQKMMTESGEGKKQKVTRDEPKLYHCESIEEEVDDE
jgi:adenine deaminase